MKALLAACLLGLCAGALADPVLLFTPGPPIAPDYPLDSSYKRGPGYKAAHAIVFNPQAFGASVVKVELKGKAHTFVMHKPQGDWTPISLWEGEEEDDTFSERPRIALRSWGKTGFSADFFLPPGGYFVSDPATPTILFEFEANDNSVYRGPAWIIWLRLFGLLIILGCIVAFGCAFIWRWVRSRLKAGAIASPAPS
jgi:hypothetical protein